MREYCIVTDSTSDLPLELISELGLTVIPMEFQLDGNAYQHHPDAREYGYHEFYERLRAGSMSTTSQINYTTYEAYFEPILQAGKDILYICFSSGLSGTYNASLLACSDLAERFPGSKVYSVDSRAASAGEGLLVFHAAQKKVQGMDIDTLRDWITQNRGHFCHWFTVDDLNHLKRGGRVTAVSAAVGTALGIKPVLNVDDDGHLIPRQKVRGRRKSLEALVEQMELTCTEPDGQTILLGHGDCVQDAEFVVELIKQKFPTIERVILTYIGPIVGTHSGPGTIALFFVGTHK